MTSQVASVAKIGSLTSCLISFFSLLEERKEGKHVRSKRPEFATLATLRRLDTRPKSPAQALSAHRSDSPCEESPPCRSSRSSQQSRLLLRRRHAVSVTGTDGQHSYRTTVTGAFTTAQNICPCVALAAPKKRYYSKVVQTTVGAIYELGDEHAEHQEVPRNAADVRRQAG